MLSIGLRNKVIKELCPLSFVLSCVQSLLTEEYRICTFIVHKHLYAQKLHNTTQKYESSNHGSEVGLSYINSLLQDQAAAAVRLIQTDTQTDRQTDGSWPVILLAQPAKLKQLTK